MCADVRTSISLDLSESSIAHAHAKAVDLGMSVSDFVEFVILVCDSLPTSLLFCLSAGVPVRFTAGAVVGGDEVE